MWPILELNCRSRSELTGSFYSNTGSQQPPAVTQGHSILIALQMGKKVNECLEKPYEWLHMHTISDILSQANRAYSTLSRKLEAVSTVQVLRLRTTSQEWTRQNVCHPQKWPTVIQDFTMAKLSILTWMYRKLLIYCHGAQEELSLSTVTWAE